MARKDSMKAATHVEYLVKGVEFTMIKLAGGTFTMGATPEQGHDALDIEKPTHKVILSSFCIGQTEVTQELWEAIMGSNPSDNKGAKHPVENVSWDDCQEFIKKLNEETGENFRLPTEAEWEYAARGGSKSQGYKFSGSNNIDNVAWYYGKYFDDYYDKSGGGTQDVATERPNEHWLYDMSGNVWEWCQDWFGAYSAETQLDPTGPELGLLRVCRGGSVFNDANNCRVSFRKTFSDDRYKNIGFRLAMDAKSDPKEKQKQLDSEKEECHDSRDANKHEEQKRLNEERKNQEAAEKRLKEEIKCQEAAEQKRQQEEEKQRQVEEKRKEKERKRQEADEQKRQQEEEKLRQTKEKGTEKDSKELIQEEIKDAEKQREELKDAIKIRRDSINPVEKARLDSMNATVYYSAKGVKFTMIKVAGGTFTMGATPEQGRDASEVEKPAHQVTVSSFSIGQTEVTQELWEAVMGNNPSHNKGAMMPVENVSWYTCQEFIKKLNEETGENFRLPTEAEWEFSARGGVKSQGNKYSGSSNIDDVAWYDGNSDYHTHNVMTKYPNELWLYDMNGNVWEWCQDWYGSYSCDSQIDPVGPSSSSYRVLRGGGYLSPAHSSRSTIRTCHQSRFKDIDLGFRLAL